MGGTGWGLVGGQVVGQVGEKVNLQQAMTNWCSFYLGRSCT